jgi:uncharacterized protein YndB with AHSA1/START domain
MRMGHDLEVDHQYRAAPQAVFDAFLGMYGERRPGWIVKSNLDLRVGGIWTVVFHPPGLETFREVRVFTQVEPPHRLA